MDAVEFIKERRRMCLSYEDCIGCPCEHGKQPISCEIQSKTAQQLVEIIEQWSQTHPQKTMIQDFFEKFPNAPKEEDGTPIDICPSYCGYTDEPNSLAVCEKFNKNCLKCWSRPLED